MALTEVLILSKKLSLCHIFGFQPLTFQTMSYVRSTNISLKYQRFKTLGSKDIGIRKSEFMAKKIEHSSKLPLNTVSNQVLFID